MRLEKIIQLFAELISKGFTGRISFDFHKGDVSKKVHREVVEVIE